MATAPVPADPGAAAAPAHASAPASAPAHQGAQPGPGGAEAAAEPDGLHVRPELWLAVLLLFALAVTTKVSGGGTAASVMLGLFALAMLVLFVVCFTGNAQCRRNDMFVYAYGFTMGSFALLALPMVVATPQPRPESLARPLELVRGCVREGAVGGLDVVSAVVRCPSGARVASGAAAAPVPASGAWPDGLPTRYTLLLAVGGATVTVHERPACAGDCGRPAAQGAAAASAGVAGAAASAASATAGGASTPVAASAPALPAPAAAAASAPCAEAACSGERSHVEVAGGLTVPYFVLVLAYVGGAVSLSRRIPEYQRRLHPDYTSTADEPAMRPFEARESVVFQIMQLVSAPFLAIATWFIVSPMTLAAAATLAFGTGFASEPLLLMIRGLVKGIRPETTRPPATAAGAVPLKGKVLPVAGQTLPAGLELVVRAEGENAVVARIPVGEGGAYSCDTLTPRRYALTPEAGGKAFGVVQLALPAKGLDNQQLQLRPA